jgi:ArsR family transcriptional regulator, arsenate/arsenite/antimonite-responsive transcriptional repressor
LTQRRDFYSFRIMKATQAIEALAALAQETRLAIFRLLVREGMAAGAIAERLEIPAPTLSFHLTQLSRAGLVTATREGRSIRYAANYSGMNALLTYITQDCCQGHPEICRPAGCAPVKGSTTLYRERSHETTSRLRGR